ncbi:hypothetical protein AKO1_006347 [Acrasis kona]|uniref:ChrR-like cupin domain-containing protein n=1 Tax=Acrasis kona TaxID=1008807 RepID=A0AAW2YJP9_9EUKA
MPKPEIEFTSSSSIIPSYLTPEDPACSGFSTLKILSRDPDTGDQTSLLNHPPGCHWGSPYCVHEFWEEAYILKGRMYDKTLKKWFDAGHFCSRPPGMKHGPYQADEEHGCEELCYISYDKIKQ